MILVKFFTDIDHALNFKKGNIKARDVKCLTDLESSKQDPNECILSSEDKIYFISWNKNITTLDKDEIIAYVDNYEKQNNEGIVPLIIFDPRGGVFIYGLNPSGSYELKELQNSILQYIKFPDKKNGNYWL